MYRRKKVFHILAILLSFLMMISVVDPVQATTISDLEKEKLALENELTKARTEAIQSQKRMEELYIDAIKAMKEYSGNGGSDYDEEYEDY